eukprot:1697694-Pleurochrysis_carterae.AAC.1
MKSKGSEREEKRHLLWSLPPRDVHALLAMCSSQPQEGATLPREAAPGSASSNENLHRGHLRKIAVLCTIEMLNTNVPIHETELYINPIRPRRHRLPTSVNQLFNLRMATVFPVLVVGCRAVEL